MNIRKLFVWCVLVALTITIIAPFSANAIENETRQIVIDFVSDIYQQVGITITSEETQHFIGQIEGAALKYQEMCNIPLERCYELLLRELDESIRVSGSGNSIRSGGAGSKPLPVSNPGDIFFVPLDYFAFNHVGLYIASNAVINASATHGVQHYNITETASYQTPKANDDSAAILRYSNNSSQASQVVEWVLLNVPDNSPYDTDFLDNKGDYYYENQGSVDMPIWVRLPESNAYNCSELVWKAYYKTLQIDLDSNGGLGVYPNDIRASSYLTVINSTWDD